MSNLSYNSDKAPLDYAWIFKEALIDSLYIRQVTYWNTRLRNASEKNVLAYCREDSAFNNDDRSFVAMFWDGEVLGLLPADEDDDRPSPYCLEVYQGDPSLLEEIEVLAAQVRKFQAERYVAQRFLASLTIFEPPPADLKEILGEGLYRICHTALSGEVGEVDYTPLHWPVSEPEALNTFVTEQQSIITQMQERVMLNMITL